MVFDSRLLAQINNIFKFHKLLLILNVYPCLILIHRVWNTKLAFDHSLKVSDLADRKFLRHNFNNFFVFINNFPTFAGIADQFLDQMNLFLLLFLSIC